MEVVRAARVLAILGLILSVSASARADVVTYDLENVILDDGNQEMLGTFTWTFDVGDFENGVGEFTFLDIPYTWHDHTDLDATFDIGGSIEITLDGSVHDDGVDITLFLLEPLTPTTGSSLDLERSKYEIGGNGFHDGAFLSGSVVPSGTADVGGLIDPAVAWMSTYPNPFHAGTTVRYSIARPGHVRLTIHDVRGRLTAALIDWWQLPGEYSVPWSAGDLDPGVYFVRIAAGAESTTRKALVIR